MLSRDSLDRLKLWQLQLKGAVAAQEHRLESLDRHILMTGTVAKEVAPFLASLDKAIAVCKNTIHQFEQASRHFATLIDSPVNDSSLPPKRITSALPGANEVPKQPDRP